MAKKSFYPSHKWYVSRGTFFCLSLFLASEILTRIVVGAR